MESTATQTFGRRSLSRWVLERVTMTTGKESFWEGRRVLVTGAAGFTGSNLCNRLAEQNADVLAFVRSNGAKASFHPNVRVLSGDLTKKEDCTRAVEGVDTVFHVAAVFRNVNVTDSHLTSVHVDATEHLVRAAKAANCRRFVHTSTIGVHGHVKNGPGDEETEFSPGDAYQITKAQGEIRAVELAKELGLDLTVVRPCAIYGPGDTRFLKLVKPINKRRFVMIGDGEARYHFVHIDDLVSGYLLAGEVDAAVGEAFLIGGSEAPTLNELAGDIAGILDVSAPKLKVPIGPVKAAAWLCERVSGLLNVEPILHRRRLAFFTKNREFSIAKAKRLLGYEPKVDLDSGLRRLIAWYRAEGLI